MTTHPDAERAIVDFDHHSDDFNLNELAVNAELRAKCPVAWNTNYGGFWFLSSYQTVSQAARDGGTFAHKYEPNADDGINYQGEMGVPRPEGQPALGIGEIDGPFHLALRHALAPFFSPGACQKLRPFMEATAEEFLAKHVGDGHMDLVLDYASPVPAILTMKLMGLPLDNWHLYANLFHSVMAMPQDSRQYAEAIGQVPAMMQEVLEFAATRRADARDDLTSFLIQFEFENAKLTDEQLLNILWNLIAGGVDTTTSHTALTLLHLGTHPELRRQLLDNPALYRTATDEFLRYFSVNQQLSRTVTRDVELGGQRLKRNDQLVLSWLAANHDDAEFDRSDEIVLDRSPNRHVAFGLGPHRCIGSHLARLMSEVLVKTVLDRIPDYVVELDGVKQYLGNPSMTGLATLPVTFTPTRQGLAVSEIAARLAEIVGDQNLLTGDAIPEDYSRDEELSLPRATPAYVAKPGTAEEVAELLKTAGEHQIPVTARGSGSGLSGAARPVHNGLVISFERMNKVLEVDTTNQVAVVQPGVTLTELDAATEPAGLRYMVYPGELSSSLGGNVGTNAGGMRAVKYGVARHNVLGLQAVLPTGEIIRTGGRIAKVSTGYDLTQLIVGSEGTLALATEVTVKLHPKLDHSATVLAPFADLDQVMTAVPQVLAHGLSPYILEYIDNMTMAAIIHTQNLELGVPDQIRDSCQAYLVVALENRAADRLAEDVERTGELLAELGAVVAYVLEGGAARRLIEAREKAFWTAKAIGADDIVDTVVPRGAMPKFLAAARDLAATAEAGVAGCGHAGDGNVHLAILCKDPVKRKQLLTDIFTLAMELGGAISGEHGLGRAKTPYFVKLEDPAKVALLRRIKESFDPAGILNPGVVFTAD